MNDREKIEIEMSLGDSLKIERASQSVDLDTLINRAIDAIEEEVKFFAHKVLTPLSC